MSKELPQLKQKADRIIREIEYFRKKIAEKEIELLAIEQQLLVLQLEE